MKRGEESTWRRRAIALFGATVIVFVILGGASFSGHERPDPYSIVFHGQTAVDGKRVWQARNCMGCHTLVGNGAYFAPDVTAVYADDGPAWIMAFFTQLKVWPTQRMTEEWIGRLRAQSALDATSPAAYYARFTAAQGDGADRGGWNILMPDLRLSEQEAWALVAYLDYASQLNTEGWPPESAAQDVVVTGAQDLLHGWAAGPTSTTTSTPDGLQGGGAQ